MANGIKDTKAIATKVSTKSFDQLHEIAKVADVTIYTLLQGVIDAYIKCFCATEPITNEIQHVIDNFGNVIKSKFGFSFTMPKLPKIEMHKFLAIIDAENTQLPEIVLIEKDGTGQVVQSQNNDAILREFLKAFAPEYLPKLEKLKIEDNKFTLFEALKYCIDFCVQNGGDDFLHEEIRQLFLDNNWIERHNISGKSGAVEMEERGYRRTMDRNNTFEKNHLKQMQEHDAEPVEDTDVLENAEPVENTDILENAEPIEDIDILEDADTLQEFEPLDTEDNGE